MKTKNMVIVGLGLIGGSLAMALKGFEGFEITGVDCSEATRRFAVEHGAADKVTDCAEEVLPQADVVVLALHPDAMIAFLEEQRERFRPGTLVCDVCGVKRVIMAAAERLPAGVDFIGCHPMAGKEVSGITHAEGTLFQGAHFLMIPRKNSTPEHIALLERMAAHIGCTDVCPTTAEEHDALVAYTSQLMHVIAAAVCDDEQLFACRGFEGSSFRGCTRVAALDVGLWTELFSLNRPALVASVDRLIDNLQSYRDVLAGGDRTALAEKLTHSSRRKRSMALPGPDLMK